MKKAGIIEESSFVQKESRWKVRFNLSREHGGGGGDIYSKHLFVAMPIQKWLGALLEKKICTQWIPVFVHCSDAKPQR